MIYRLLAAAEVPCLVKPMRELADYHNRVAKSFAGCYPVIPVEKQLGELAEQIEAKKGMAEAIFDGEDVVGFGAATFEGHYGNIDFLYIREELRRKRHGHRLLKNMLAFLRANGVTFIDLKVVRGNPARRFYENHGFRPRTEVMTMRIPDDSSAAPTATPPDPGEGHAENHRD